MSSASPVASCSTATRHGTPLPARYSLRTVWPGPLGAIMMTFTFFGGLMQPKWMLKPWAKARVLPSVM